MVRYCSYIVSAEPSCTICCGDERDDSDDNNKVNIALVAIMIIGVIGLVISIVINVILAVKLKQSRCVVTSIHSM